MKVFIISDKEYQTNQLHQLNHLLREYFENKEFEIEHVIVDRNNITFCKGCFGCWVKKPGECIFNDDISRINRTTMNSDVVIYLSPVIFGQFSANIKNVIDRLLPNILPFFDTRPDGSTTHPHRYSSYPTQIIIGYSEELSKDDEVLFLDITKKHCPDVEVLIWKGLNMEAIEELDKIKMERVGGRL